MVNRKVTIFHVGFSEKTLSVGHSYRQAFFSFGVEAATNGSHNFRLELPLNQF